MSIGLTKLTYTKMRKLYEFRIEELKKFFHLIMSSLKIAAGSFIDERVFGTSITGENVMVHVQINFDNRHD